MGSQRRRRRRTRKRRYVSLRRRLSRITSPETAHVMVSDDHHRQLDLFPLHPEPIHAEEEEEEEVEEEEEELEGRKCAAKFFDQECDTLNSILGSAARPNEEPTSPTHHHLDSHQTNPSGGGFLARRALKGRERCAFCNVDDKEEGQGSSGGGCCGRDTWWDAPSGMLCLKLDYQEILTAWPDKRPLYVDAEEPHMAPSVSPYKHQFYASTRVYVEVGGGGGNNSSSCSSNLWMVPENREARVMRYREKRQSRLFAKKIRYEVRKLNAEKRPRIKGRFVKRMEVK